jgi:hypothetical protein
MPEPSSLSENPAALAARAFELAAVVEQSNAAQDAAAVPALKAVERLRRTVERVLAPKVQAADRLHQRVIELPTGDGWQILDHLDVLVGTLGLPASYEDAAHNRLNPPAPVAETAPEPRDEAFEHTYHHYDGAHPGCPYCPAETAPEPRTVDVWTPYPSEAPKPSDCTCTVMTCDEDGCPYCSTADGELPCPKDDDYVAETAVAQPAEHPDPWAMEPIEPVEPSEVEP